MAYDTTKLTNNQIVCPSFLITHLLWTLPCALGAGAAWRGDPRLPQVHRAGTDLAAQGLGRMCWGSGAGEGGAAGGGGGLSFLLRWRGWQDRVAADPNFPYKVFIEQA